MKHWEQFFLTAGYIHHQSSQAICVVVVCGMKMKMKILELCLFMIRYEVKVQSKLFDQYEKSNVASGKFTLSHLRYRQN